MGDSGPFRGKTRGSPTPQEWETNKDMIVKLYMHDDFRLQQVQCIMEAQYGLKASVRQYLKRLHRWGIKKNLKVAEKDALMHQFAAALASNQTPDLISLDERKVMWHKVKRHAKARARDKHTPRATMQLQDKFSDQSMDGSSEKLMVIEVSSVSPEIATDRLSQVAFTPQTSPTPQSRSPASDGVLCTELVKHRAQSRGLSRSISPSRENLNLELVLHQISALSEVQFRVLRLRSVTNITCDATGSLRKINDKQQRVAKMFWPKVKTAVYLQKTDPASAVVLLKDICDLDAEVVQIPPLDTVRNTLAALSPVNVRIDPSIRTKVLRRLASVVERQLGPTYPLTVILEELKRDDLTRHTSEMVLGYLGSLFAGEFGESSVHAHQIRSDIVNLLRRDNAMVEAENLALLAMNECRRIFGSRSEEFQKALTDLVHIYTKQREYDFALQICHHFLQMRQLQLGPCYPDSKASYMMENIAELHDCKQDDSSCIFWLRQALLSAWHSRGGVVSTIHVRDKLSAMLIKCGCSEQASQLLPDFPLVTPGMA